MIFLYLYTFFYIINLQIVENAWTSTSSNRGKRAVVVNQIWKSPVVPFSLDKNLPDVVKHCIRNAIGQIEKYSCATFNDIDEFKKELNKLNSDQYQSIIEKAKGITTHYLNFVKSDDQGKCESGVGTSKPDPSGKLVGHEIRLGARCGSTNQTCIHEIMHSIGFDHEHERPDRNKFIHINMTNIREGMTGAFTKVYESGDYDYLTPYDISSIMHYGAKTFTSDADNIVINSINPIMEGSIGSTEMSDPLSFRDKKALNFVFKCAEKCQNVVTCEQGGYIGHDCKCVCPFGFKGDTCETLIYAKHYTHDSCGYVYSPTNKGKIVSPNYPKSYPSATMCQWLIKANKSTELIRFKFNKIDLDYNGRRAGQRCADLIQIWPYGTDVLTHYLGCSPEVVGKYMNQWFTTQDSFLLIEFRSNQYPIHDLNHFGFELEYEIFDTAPPPTDKPMVSDGRDKNKIKDPRWKLVDSFNMSKQLSCHKCSGTVECESLEIGDESDHLCSKNHFCAWDEESGDVKWRGCKPRSHCIKHWLECSSESNLDCFTCCLNNFCNSDAFSVTISVFLLLSVLLAFFIDF